MIKTSTRTLLIGKLTVTIQNVPDNYTDDQLRSLTLKKLFIDAKSKAKGDLRGFNRAS